VASHGGKNWPPEFRAESAGGQAVSA